MLWLCYWLLHILVCPRLIFGWFWSSLIFFVRNKKIWLSHLRLPWKVANFLILCSSWKSRWDLQLLLLKKWSRVHLNCTGIKMPEIIRKRIKWKAAKIHVNLRLNINWMYLIYPNRKHFIFRTLVESTIRFKNKWMSLAKHEVRLDVLHNFEVFLMK